MSGAVKYPNAIGPALRVYGRVLKQHWPMLLALTVAYPLVSWGASLAWKALPVATGWVEIGLRGLQMLVWAMAWGLMGAVLAQLTLATTDRRPADPGALLRACASALPVVVVLVLLTDASSLPLSLWRTQIAASGQVTQAGLLVLLSLPFAILDVVVIWFLAMAVPFRLDRDLSLLGSLKASARLGRRRWRTIVMVFLVAGLGVLALSALLAALSLTGRDPADGQAPSWMTDNYLWRIPGQVLSMAWILFWPSLYVVFRDQEGTGVVAETFD
jgi:hypothetical protein